jgi:sigma-54 specific flagellar transcriptional regulator A
VADTSIDDSDAAASNSEGHGDLPSQPSIPQGGVDLRQMMAEFESAWIREAMRMTDGNVSHAAELLGMRRTTFIERLRKYEPSDSRQ